MVSRAMNGCGEKILYYFFFFIIWINCGKSASHCKRAKESFCNIIVGNYSNKYQPKVYDNFPQRTDCMYSRFRNIKKIEKKCGLIYFIYIARHPGYEKPFLFPPTKKKKKKGYKILLRFQAFLSLSFAQPTILYV